MSHSLYKEFIVSTMMKWRKKITKTTEIEKTLKNLEMKIEDEILLLIIYVDS